MSDCLFKIGNLYYSLNEKEEIIYSANDTLEKFPFDSYSYFIRQNVKFVKQAIGINTKLAGLTVDTYPLKNNYYTKINSVVSNENTKFLIKDGNNVYSVNPLTLLNSTGEITIDTVNTSGKTTVVLTKDELKTLSANSMLLAYIDTAEGLSTTAVFDIEMNRSFICCFDEPEAKLLYSNVDVPLEDTVEICALERTSFSYKVKMRGSDNAYVEETVNDEVDSTITIPSSQFTTSENPYHVDIEVVDEKLRTYTKTTTLSLQNTEPNILVTMTNMIARIDFNDPENNKIQYKVLLNGKQITPKTGDYTDFVDTPCFFTSRFKSDSIIVGGNNILEILAIDEYGKKGKLIYNFTGKLSGLLFIDENGRVCSDDLGNIIRTFDLGKIDAGRTSEVKKVIIRNTCGYDVINAKIDLEALNPDSRYTVYISKSNAPFVDNNSLTINEIINNTEDEFYVKVVTNPDIEYGSNFYINVQSEPRR